MWCNRIYSGTMQYFFLTPSSISSWTAELCSLQICDIKMELLQFYNIAVCSQFSAAHLPIFAPVLSVNPVYALTLFGEILFARLSIELPLNNVICLFHFPALLDLGSMEDSLKYRRISIFTVNVERSSCGHDLTTCNKIMSDFNNSPFFYIAYFT